MASRLGEIRESEWCERAKTANYRVSRLARDADVSRRHLLRHFLCHFNITPKQWLDRQWIQDAHLRLRKGELVKAICQEFGFKHPNHFARSFRRVAGHSPNENQALPVLRFRVKIQRSRKKVQNVPKRSARILASRKR